MKSGVIDEILDVEDEAERIVEDAQKTAKEIVDDAHEKAAKLVSSSIEAVKERSRAEVQSAQAQLEAELSDYEEEKRRMESTGDSMDEDAKERAVSRVIDRILTVGE